MPEADAQEQDTPAEPATTAPEIDGRVAAPLDVPEADRLDQLTPAAPETAAAPPSLGSLVPEADAWEQAMPADRELYDQDDH